MKLVVLFEFDEVFFFVLNERNCYELNKLFDVKEGGPKYQEQMKRISAKESQSDLLDDLFVLNFLTTFNSSNR